MKPWYQEGLKFKCTGCGQCCTGFPGHVWVTPKEIDAIAKTLGISSEEVVAKYARRIGNRISLRELPKTYDCIFLKGKQCSIYGARPKQCRTFPWWPENLPSRKEWEELAKHCEGVNHVDAPVVAFGEIQRQLHIQQGKAEEEES